MQLDGLRGVAALIVVVHHAALMSQSFALTYFGGPPPETGSLIWWVTETPLKLFTAGGEAVTVFFVLSGLVLTLPVLSKPDFDFWAYYPRRAVRLYLPVIASIVFAAVLMLAFRPRDDAAAFSEWSRRWIVADARPLEFLIATNHSSPQLFSPMDLLFGDTGLNNPLWSLRWEVLFSFVLPLVVLGALLLRRHPALALIGASAAVGASTLLGIPSLRYMPAFLIGAVIAVTLTALQNRADHLSVRRHSWLIWSLLLVGALVALIAYWLVGPEIRDDVRVRAMTIGLSTLGASMLVLIVAFWRPAATLFATRPIQWLGRISFSLYLVHVPILLAAHFVFGSTRWWLAALVGIPISFVVGAVFTRFIEVPSHTLSKRVGAAASRAVRRLHAPLSTPD